MKRPGNSLPFERDFLDTLVDEDCCIRGSHDQTRVRDDELVQCERGQKGRQDLLLREPAECVDLNKVRCKEDVERSCVLLPSCPFPGFLVGEEDGC